MRERRGRVRAGARHGAGRAQHARAPTSRSIRSWGANRADGVAHLEGARPAHGLRGPERGAARGLGLQVELVCERVSRERGPPDTILRERWRVRVRGRKNPILVRSGGRGAFAARGLDREEWATAAFAGGREVALFATRAHRDRAPGMARSGPRRSPPRQKLTLLRGAPSVRYVLSAGLRSAHLRLRSARVSQPSGRHVFPVGSHGRGLLPLPSLAQS